MAKGFLYLIAIIDWHSRAVLGWRLSSTLGAEFRVEALQEALARHGRPEIFNTDQSLPQRRLGVASSPAPRSPACSSVAGLLPARPLARRTEATTLVTVDIETGTTRMKYLHNPLPGSGAGEEPTKSNSECVVRPWRTWQQYGVRRGWSHGWGIPVAGYGAGLRPTPAFSTKDQPPRRRHGRRYLIRG
jgi:hypothetical protein